MNLLFHNISKNKTEHVNFMRKNQENYYKKIEDHIIKNVKILNSDILKVNIFLKHQINPKLAKEIDQEFYSYFN